MENNFRIEYAQNELNKAQAIENYVRSGVAKDLDGVIDNLLDVDANGDKMTPANECIDALAFYIALLKDVSEDAAWRKERLDAIVKEEQSKAKADEVTE